MEGADEIPPAPLYERENETWLLPPFLKGIGAILRSMAGDSDAHGGGPIVTRTTTMTPATKYGEAAHANKEEENRAG